MRAGSPSGPVSPWPRGKPLQIWTARLACAGVIGRIDTTMGPRNTPAGRHGDVGAIHRHIAAGFEVPDRAARPPATHVSKVKEQPRRKADQVVAPEVLTIVRLIDQLALPVDAIARQIGPQIGAGGDRAARGSPGSVTSKSGHGLGFRWQKQQEVEGQVPGVAITRLACTKPGARPGVGLVHSPVRAAMRTWAGVASRWLFMKDCPFQLGAKRP